MQLFIASSIKNSNSKFTNFESISIDTKILLGYYSYKKKTKEKYKKMTKAKTVVSVHTDSLSEIKIDTSRDRKNLLFCGMQN